jgi:hypothetical protein
MLAHPLCFLAGRCGPVWRASRLFYYSENGEDGNDGATAVSNRLEFTDRDWATLKEWPNLKERSFLDRGSV